MHNKKQGVKYKYGFVYGITEYLVASSPSPPMENTASDQKLGPRDS